MRNLRKYFAVFVAVALLVTAVAPAFAADTASTTTTSAPAMTDAKVCETLGVLVGDGSGVTDAYLASTPTKLQAAIMFLRLKGLEKEAIAFKGTDSFKDADLVDWDAGQAILAYLKSKPELGFNGNPDGTFDPNATITAQQYYKILLVGLGYKEDTGKGGDFKYDDVLKFAESKGLKKAAASKNFSINDVAVATVEALKANMADGKKTLIQSLIDAKVVGQDNAAKAGLVAGSGPATAFELTAKTAKSLYAKLNGVVADTSKVTVTVTRDAGVAVSLTATWDKDKAGVMLTNISSLVAGEYKVAIKDDKTDLGSKTVSIEAEKLAKIEMVSKIITRRSDSDGVAYYKVTNQYGDDVTKNPIASNITWNSSLGTANGASITADKGILTFHKNDNSGDSLNVYMGLLKDQQSVVVTAYDSDSNVVMNDSLTVSSTIGDIQSLKLLGLSNKDKKTNLEKNSTDVFYLDFEAKDSNGNLVTDYEIFRNTNAFRLSPGSQTESTVAYAEVVQDPNDNKQAKIQVKVPASGGIAGSQVISAVSITTGKNATFTVEVKEGAALTQFILQKPAQDVAVYDGYVEVPYLAYDSNGNALTDYSKIKYDSVTNPSGVRLSGASNVQEIQNPDGTYKLLVDFGNQKTTLTLSATCTTTTSVKMSTMSISVKDAAAPKTFVKIDNKAFVSAMVYGATTGDKLSKVTIYDQYDRPLDFRFRSNKFQVNENNATKKYFYFVMASMNSQDNDKFTLGPVVGSHVYQQIAIGGGNKIHVTANAIAGSANITFALYRSESQPMRAYKLNDAGTGNAQIVDPTWVGDTSTPLSDDAKAHLIDAVNDLSGGNVEGQSALTVNDPLPSDAKLIDSKTFTWYNVDKKDISSYEIQGLDSTLYAQKNSDDPSGTWRWNKLPSDASDTYRGGNASYSIYQTKDTYFGEYVSDALVKGKYNGMTVELKPSDVLSYSVSDTNKFGYILEASNNSYKVYTNGTIPQFDGDRKVFAKYVDDKPYTGNVTAVVRGYNNVTQTASAAINSKPSDTDKSYAVSIGVDQPDPGIIKPITNNANKSSYAVLINPLKDADGNYIVIRPFVSFGRSGDIYKVSEQFAADYLIGKRILKYNINTTLIGGSNEKWYGHKNEITDPKVKQSASVEYRAGIYFNVKDQYGKAGLAPSNVIATIADRAADKVTAYGATPTLSYDSTTGILTSSAALKDGDIVTLTAYTGNGLSKSIKIYVVKGAFNNDGTLDADSHALYDYAHQ